MLQVVHLPEHEGLSITINCFQLLIGKRYPVPPAVPVLASACLGCQFFLQCYHERTLRGSMQTRPKQPQTEQRMTCNFEPNALGAHLLKLPVTTVGNNRRRQRVIEQRRRLPPYRRFDGRRGELDGAISGLGALRQGQEERDFRLGLLPPAPRRLPSVRLVHLRQRTRTRGDLSRPLGVGLHGANQLGYLATLLSRYRGLPTVFNLLAPTSLPHLEKPHSEWQEAGQANVHGQDPL